MAFYYRGRSYQASSPLSKVLDYLLLTISPAPTPCSLLPAPCPLLADTQQIRLDMLLRIILLLALTEQYCSTRSLNLAAHY